MAIKFLGFDFYEGYVICVESTLRTLFKYIQKPGCGMLAQSTGGVPGDVRCDRMQIPINIHQQGTGYFYINIPDILF